MNAPIAGALFAVALLKLSPLTAAPLSLNSYIRANIEPLDVVSVDEWREPIRRVPLTRSLEGGSGLSTGIADGALVRWAMENGASAHFDPIPHISSAEAGGGSIPDVGPCFPPFVWTTGVLLLLCVIPSHRRRHSARVF